VGLVVRVIASRPWPSAAANDRKNSMWQLLAAAQAGVEGFHVAIIG
jgi:hypothetical protein